MRWLWSCPRKLIKNSHFNIAPGCRGRPYVGGLVFLCLILLAGFPPVLYGQENTGNLYSLENSQQYAEHLYASRRYLLAAEEYDRVYFMDSSRTLAAIRSLECYRLGNQYAEGLAAGRRHWADLQAAPPQAALEMGKLLIRNADFNLAFTLIGDSLNLEPQSRSFLLMHQALFSRQWEQAMAHYRNWSSVLETEDKDAPVYGPIVQAAQSLKYKKGGIAMAMSVVVPGAGKCYAGQWGDGLSAFFLTALPSFQAWRIFRKDGIQSPLGWAFASLGGVFYTVNIMGSWRSARRYNDKLDHDILHKVEDAMESSF